MDTGRARTPLRVAIAEANRPMRRALAEMVLAAPGIELVGETADLTGLLRALEVHRPEVLLLDPGVLAPHGLAALVMVCSASPITAVLVCDFGDWGGYEARARELGAAGFIPKTAAPDTWLAAIRAAGRGDVTS